MSTNILDTDKLLVTAFAGANQTPMIQIILKDRGPRFPHVQLDGAEVAELRDTLNKWRGEHYHE